VTEEAPEDLWEKQAGWWQREFTEGADPEYTEQILPLINQWIGGRDRVLDVGTGEGQVARMLAAGGASVTGVDPTWNQVLEASERGGGPRFGRADAAHLPFRDDSFDAAVACLVFEHIDDAFGAVAEIARVLEPGGRFAFLLNHPLLQCPNSGWIDDQVLDPPEQYWRVGAYLVEEKVIDEVVKGIFIPFIHRPLSRYINAMADAGLVLRHMAEPPPPPGFLALATEYVDAVTIPRLLLLVAESPS
jgi:SAM-dependent methyltransferase